MPELPEVETIRRTLRPELAGAAVTAVDVRSRDVIARPDAPTFARRLTGCRFVDVGRRGKYLLLALANDEDPCGVEAVLVAHLRMTGRLVVAPAAAPEYPHTHVVLALRDGRELRLSDVRRFGRLYLYEVGELPPALLRAAGISAAGVNGRGRTRVWGDRRRLKDGLFALGPEPLGPGFTAERLAKRLQGRQAPIKAALLDQRIVAGLGNIYVDEALFRARIHPATPAGRLDAAACERLVRAIRRVLRAAIAQRGTTLADYVDGRGMPGSMRAALAVYGRAGEPCRRCRTPLVKTRIAGRGTHYCPRCQPPPVPDV